MDNTNNMIKDDTEETAFEQEEAVRFKISHLVSADGLKVYIRIESPDNQAELSCEEILDYLAEKNIVYGIRKDEIKNYCTKKEYSKELVAASGKEPVNGTDAQLVYDFDISKENIFIEDEDGRIDFRNLNNVINVTKDTVLCHIIPAKEGENGIDVYGKPVYYKPGKNVSFNCGKNTHISDDGLKLLASTEGCIEFKNNKVFVEGVYRVENVDNSTGNIDFVGSVIINGDVKEGFSVKAVGDIKVRGMVEGAFIESDSDIVISKGMNGMGKGTIYAKGNVTSKYIENAKIETLKTVYAEVLINSNVKAADSIILRGSNAAIIGGTSEAVNVIYAKTIGSKTNLETNLIIDLTKYQEEQKIIDIKKKSNFRLEKDLVLKKKELKEIDEKMDLILNSSLDNENKNNVHKQLVLMKIKVNNEIYEIERQLTEIIPTDNIANHKIICKNIMYSNTRISIGWMKFRVRQDISYSKIYNDGDDISIVTLNSADLEI